MRYLCNIVVTQRLLSARVQARGRAAAWPGPGRARSQGRCQIQPCHHIRANQDEYGMTWAVSKGYM
jgi:hypothetical protein